MGPQGKYNSCNLLPAGMQKMAEVEGRIWRGIGHILRPRDKGMQRHGQLGQAARQHGSILKPSTELRRTVSVLRKSHLYH
jgi:hypothetical protein